MELLTMLISFALVNVFVAELDEYGEEVFITNYYIQKAGAHLPTVIRNIVLGEYTIEQMALMLAVPNRTPNIRPNEKRRIYKQGMLGYQIQMQNEVKKVIDINPLEIDEVAFENANLSSLGSARRDVIIEAVKYLIRSAIGGDPDFNVSVPGFRLTCRLLGLFKSIETPIPYTCSAEVIDGTCIIKCRNKSEKMYKYIDGNICQLNSNPSGAPYQLLSSQVQ